MNITSHTLIITIWLILLLIVFTFILIYLFKTPKHNKTLTADNAFELVFKRQIELLKKIEEGSALQVNMFDSLNHNIMENYRILLQTQIKELLIYNPSDEDGILRLYNDYSGITEQPNISLENAINEWKKTRSIPLPRHKFKKFSKVVEPE